MRSNPAWRLVLACALVACGSPSSKEPPAKASPDKASPETKPPEAAKPADPTADGKNPCELLRPLLSGVDRESLDRDPWTKDKPATQKMMALDEGVAASIGVCIADHWSEATIRCILDAKDGTAQDRCGLAPEEDRRADAATEAVYTRIFGPRP